jgi:hypothetical protein
MVQAMIAEYPPGALHRLAPRFTTVRDDYWHLAGRSCADAPETLPCGRQAGFPYAGTEIDLRDARPRTVAISARHSGGREAALLDNFSDFAGSIDVEAQALAG